MRELLLLGSVALLLAAADAAPTPAPQPPPPTPPASAPPASAPPASAPPASALPAPAPQASAPQASATQASAPVPPPATGPAQAPELVQAEATGVLSRMVKDADGREIGRIVDVVVEPSGQPRAIVVDIGGFMGVGARRVAVSWTSVHVPAPGDKDGDVAIDLTDAQVRTAPEYTDRSKPATIVGLPAAAAAAAPEPAPPPPPPDAAAPQPGSGEPISK